MRDEASPEARLRRRIRRLLSQAGLDRVHSAIMMSNIETEIIRLFEDYAKAPDWMKADVYAAGEARILRALAQSKFTPEGQTNSGSIAI